MKKEHIKMVYFRKFLLLGLSILLVNYSSDISAQCTGSGGIDTGFSDPAFLDPDGDDDIVAGGTAFSACTGELAEFEQIVNAGGCGTCQVPWTAIGVTEDGSDLWSGGGCGNTDLVSDGTDGSFAYFSITDPDGTCNNGDEILAFRLRNSGDFSGNFGFAFFVSNDGLTGTNDADGIQCCNKTANSGFEYEVHLKTGGSGPGINIYDVNGVVGTDNCSGASPPCPFYSLSTNAQKSYACGSACGCRSGGSNDPVFITFFVLLSDLGVDCNSYTDLTFVPASTTSGNPILSGCTSLSDIGGVAGSSTIGVECPECDGVTYSGCTQSALACALNCAAEKNAFSSALPVALRDIRASEEQSTNLLEWLTEAEVNILSYEIERSPDGRSHFQKIGELAAIGSSTTQQWYQFSDEQPPAVAYYRIKSVEVQGDYYYSNTLIVQRRGDDFKLKMAFPSATNDLLTIAYSSPSTEKLWLFITNMSGKIVHEQNFSARRGEGLLTLEISHLSKGLYLLSIPTSHAYQNLKIMKL